MTATKSDKIMHFPAPGPDYWRFRCLICDGNVADHGSWFQILRFKMGKK